MVFGWGKKKEEKAKLEKEQNELKDELNILLDDLNEKTFTGQLYGNFHPKGSEVSYYKIDYLTKNLVIKNKSPLVQMEVKADIGFDMETGEISFKEYFDEKFHKEYTPDEIDDFGRKGIMSTMYLNKDPRFVLTGLLRSKSTVRKDDNTYVVSKEVKDVLFGKMQQFFEFEVSDGVLKKMTEYTELDGDSRDKSYIEFEYD